MKLFFEFLQNILEKIRFIRHLNLVTSNHSRKIASCTFEDKIVNSFLKWLVSALNWPELLSKDAKAINMRFCM